MKSVMMPKIWIFFFVLICVLVIASLLQPTTKSQEIPTPSQTASNQALPTSREENADAMLKKGDHSIYLGDQSSGETNVLIGYAVFGKSGFITIREDNGGMPGNIIGVSELVNGRVDALTIKTKSALQADQVYYAELVNDNGDGIFEETVDLSVNDKDQSVVLMSFLARANSVSTAP